MQGKPKGFYRMEDLLMPYFKLQESESEILQAKKNPGGSFWGQLTKRKKSYANESELLIDKHY